MKKQLKGIAEVKKIKTLKTALGNNILCNDKFGILSKEFSDKELKDVIDFEDIKTYKIVTDSLEELEKLNWLPQKIEDISMWIEFNQEKASKIS